MSGDPTGWFLASDPDVDGGRPFSCARWFWPPSTLVEVWDVGSRSWLPNDSFLSINDDPKWTRVTQEQVDAWIRGTGSGQDR